jgi:ATP-binding cassette subfamily B protein/ATP-binding cassette subfamily C protein
MNKFSSLTKNLFRALGLSFRFLPAITTGTFIVSILTALAPIYQAKILGDIVNQLVDSVTSSKPLSSIFILIMIYAGVEGASRILSAFELYIEKVWRDKIHHKLELMVLRKRTEIDLGHYESPDFQNLLLRAFSQGVAGPFVEIIDNLFVIIGSLGVILMSSIITSSIGWDVYVLIIASAVPSFLVQVKYGHKVWGIWAEHSERQKRYNSFRREILSRTGITQIKLLQNSERLLSIIDSIFVSFTKDNNKVDRERFLLQSLTAIIAVVGFGYSLLLIARSVSLGEISIGTLVFVIGTLAALTRALNILLSRFAGLVSKNLYMNDIFKVLDTKPFLTKSQNSIPLHLLKAPTIEFRNVSFKYEGRDAWILRNITITIEAGEKIALVGSNGAGKSTFIKLLSRIYDPTEGDIFINGINLKEIDIEEWVSYLSVLLQDYENYDLTISESIGMGRITKEASAPLVEEVALRSGASEFIETYEKKYDQQLGKEFDGGLELSKGQNQKLALARTLFRDGFVIILDEPTAAVDAMSEMKIFEKMEEAVHSNTLILITHRFNTIQQVNRIVVIERGEIQEIGSHNELMMKKKSIYKEMYNSQAKIFQNTKF